MIKPSNGQAHYAVFNGFIKSHDDTLHVSFTDNTGAVNLYSRGEINFFGPQEHHQQEVDRKQVDHS